MYFLYLRDHKIDDSSDDKTMATTALFSHPRVLNAPMKQFPLEFGIGWRGPEFFCDGATRWLEKF